MVPMYKLGSFNPVEGVPADVTLSVFFIVLMGFAVVTAYTLMKSFER